MREREREREKKERRERRERRREYKGIHYALTFVLPTVPHTIT